MSILVTAELAIAIAKTLGISRVRALIVAYITYVATILGTIAVAAGLLFWPVALAGFWSDMVRASQILWIRILIVGVCCGIGGLLYIARSFLPKVYGSAEVVLGCAACWAGLGNVSADRLSGTCAVAGGIYIIVRGIDNFRGD